MRLNFKKEKKNTKNGNNDLKSQRKEGRDQHHHHTMAMQKEQRPESYSTKILGFLSFQTDE